jgi:aspartate kinase
MGHGTSSPEWRGHLAYTIQCEYVYAPAPLQPVPILEIRISGALRAGQDGPVRSAGEKGLFEEKLRMARIVQKFGGTSVGDLDRIRNVATRVKKEVDAGNEVAVVVSAMAGETNKLVGLVDGISNMYDAREYDAVVASGEQVTAGLLALCLQDMGIEARSWLGWQIPIHTTGAHGKARIVEIESADMLKRMAVGEVCVVAGFQGLGPDSRITTLGRGGSDTSAVALAAALEADRCDIYTDVDGVYTGDPRIISKARKLDKITYEEMLESASVGTKVLQTRSVEVAMKHGVRLQVLSSFEDKPGTLVVDEDEIVEQELVSGIAYSRDEAKITLTGVADRPGVAAHIFGPLSEANINVDMIVQNVSHDGSTTDLTFTVSKADADKAVATIEKAKGELEYDGLLADKDVVKVSVIGVGMRSHAGVAQKMFETLAEKGINIQVISTSEIKVSVLIAEEYTELALRALHTAYGLDAE